MEGRMRGGLERPREVVAAHPCAQSTRFLRSESRCLPFLQLLVLASLDDGPKHGHAMRTVIQQMFGKKLGPGALYGAINRLADKGWITPLPPSARRQPYESTESGRAYLRKASR